MKKIFLLLLLNWTTYFLAQSDCSSEVFTGTGTYYIDAGTTPGSCSFPITENLPYICAMNQEQYNTASLCGTCLEVSGDLGTEIVYVVDQFSPSSTGDLDFNQAAFEAIIGNTNMGSGAISWKVVSCPLTAFPLEVTIGLGANPFYHVFLIHRHVNQISLVEEWINNSWTPMARLTNNMWELSVNNISSTDIRVTDVFGEQIVVTDIDINNTTSPYFASNNFSICVGQNDLSDLGKLYPTIHVGPTEIVVSSEKLFNSVRIIDMNGRILVDRQMETSVNSVNLPITVLTPGAHIVQLQDQEDNLIGTGRLLIN